MYLIVKRYYSRQKTIDGEELWFIMANQPDSVVMPDTPALSLAGEPF